MKKSLLASLLGLLAANASAQLTITGVYDGPLPGGLPKGVELYVSEDITDLSAYGLGSANNGGGSNGEEFVFPPEAITAGSYITVASEVDGFSEFFGFAPDYIAASAMSINGDDAIELFYNGVVTDQFGEPDVDGTDQAWEYLDGWAYRKSGTNTAASFNVSDWQFSGANALDGASDNASAANAVPLASFSFSQPEPTPANVLINELDADTEGADTAEFIELFDGGTGHTDLSGLALVLFNGIGDTSYYCVDLTGYTTDADGYFVLGNAAVTSADLILPDNGLQNGADAAVLVSAGAFANGTALPDNNIVDALVYGTNDADDTELLALLNPNQPQVNESAGSGSALDSNQRCANGAGGARNTDSFIQAEPSPGTANNCSPVIAELTLISAIQGNPGTYASNSFGETDVSPMQGSIVTVEAIVVGDFQDDDADTARNLNGFYLQEETSDEDGDPLSSEGIFVFGDSTDVALGDKVRLTARVDQYYGETQLSNITELTVLDSNRLTDVTPATIQLASNTATTTGQNGNVQPDLEAYEGMLVTFADTLTVTEQYQLDRFNEIKLVAGARPYQFTQQNTPSVTGLAQHLQSVGARTITYDDGLNTQNASINNLDGYAPYNEASAKRMGDTISGLSGVLDYKWAGNSASGATWRVRSHQDGSNLFSSVAQGNSTNPRSAPPELSGALTLASLNVLNYFTTLDNGATTAVGLDPRGANNPDELARQQAKLINAIVGLDADVLTLVEIENDFDSVNDGSTAIETLVSAINAKLGNTRYDYVFPGQRFVGTDAIAVALIYDTQTTELATGSSPALLDDSAAAQLDVFASRDFTANPIFNGPATNRVALAASFTHKDSGEQFTVAANHFKSKGSSSLSDTTSPNYDQNDGAGFWNQRRLDAASALLSWLETSPTGLTDSDIAITGDLNAYALEAPVQYLLNQGFVNPEGEQDYSYVFDGQVGTLDYILLSGDFSDKYSESAVWHINADEADALDYNLDFGRDPGYFNDASAVRASDHDPLIVSFNVAQTPAISIAMLNDELRTLLQNKTITGAGRWHFLQPLNALLYYGLLQKAAWHEQRGRITTACRYLAHAQERADGNARPTDWISGSGLGQWQTLLSTTQQSNCAP
ncbi:ExeM/NucH family extracellular endonuclease [uncultured Gilvimarinus sp.]|uniref:ExeM/NucH family extracellular endonuclease n=1 Tax=uncultured Gilvimarinus sp. TaxID=1689143 RepID=UPI0030EE82A0